MTPRCCFSFSISLLPVPIYPQKSLGHCRCSRFLPLMAAHVLAKLPPAHPFSKSGIKVEPCLRSPSLDLRLPALRSSWLGNKFAVSPSNSMPKEPKRWPVNATISFSLPTANPDRVSSSNKVPKWSRRAIKSFAMGELEARKLKYPNTGTESILMGILVEGTSLASKFLRANGITLLKAREEIVKLLGKGDMYFFSPEHPPLTEEAQRVLDWAVDNKLKSGGVGEISTSHLLLGIWSEKESPGCKILAMLGFNDEKAKELESLDSESMG